MRTQLLCTMIASALVSAGCVPRGHMSSAGDVHAGDAGVSGDGAVAPPNDLAELSPDLAGPIGDNASRFLAQATFGATRDTIASTKTMTYGDWLTQQKMQKPSLVYPLTHQNSWNWERAWWNNVVTGPDQLRQRMAWALSQILVISGQAAVLVDNEDALAGYYDLLVNDAFGNYRDLLEDVTLSVAMGRYLSSFQNDKPDPTTGTHADQNYAREVMQLFTIGLVQLNLDGSAKLDGMGNPLSTYAQADVENMANVFTGWASNKGNGAENDWQYDLDFTQPMYAFPTHHDSTDAKTIVGGVVIPAGGTPQSDLKAALDTLFNHANVGPFLGRQLIQRLVTSNPSPGYVARVAAVFNDNGQGVRGDLWAVLVAILTDLEAVDGVTTQQPQFGKVREPLIRLAHTWRAFNAVIMDPSDSSNYFSSWWDSLLDRYGEEPLGSLSVFNFYQPSYSPAGVLTNAKLAAPELEITDERLVVQVSNYLRSVTLYYKGTPNLYGNDANGFGNNVYGGDDPHNIDVDLTGWESIGQDPQMLVDTLDDVFMAGQMPAAMKTLLVNYATAVPASDLDRRIAETTFLVISSPQYAVER